MLLEHKQALLYSFYSFADHAQKEAYFMYRGNNGRLCCETMINLCIQRMAVQFNCQIKSVAFQKKLEKVNEYVKDYKTPETLYKGTSKIFKYMLEMVQEFSPFFHE